MEEIDKVYPKLLNVIKNDIKRFKKEIEWNYS